MLGNLEVFGAVIGLFIKIKKMRPVTICGAASRSGTNCDCKTDWLWVRSPLEEMKYLLKKLYFHFIGLVSRQSTALGSATQHAMPPEFGRKWGTECLNTRFPLPSLLCAGYSVKLILFISIYRCMYCCMLLFTCI